MEYGGRGVKLHERSVHGNVVFYDPTSTDFEEVNVVCPQFFVLTIEELQEIQRARKRDR